MSSFFDDFYLMIELLTQTANIEKLQKQFRTKKLLISDAEINKRLDNAGWKITKLLKQICKIFCNFRP